MNAFIKCLLCVNCWSSDNKKWEENLNLTPRTFGFFEIIMRDIFTDATSKYWPEWKHDSEPNLVI